MLLPSTAADAPVWVVSLVDTAGIARYLVLDAPPPAAIIVPGRLFEHLRFVRTTRRDDANLLIYRPHERHGSFLWRQGQEERPR